MELIISGLIGFFAYIFGYMSSHKTPVTLEGLRKFDHLPADQAVVEAWTSLGSNPSWGLKSKQLVRDAMPLLARALDRMVEK